MSANKITDQWKQAKRVCRLTWRAQRLMWKESKGYTILCYVDLILNSCSPYWNIYFSARLLDEILYRRDVVWLIRFAAILLGGGFVLDFIKNLIQTALNLGQFAFAYKERMIFSRKIMGMDYELLEDAKIHSMYRRVERETFNDGQNLELLRYCMPGFVSCLISMGVAVTMVSSLFIQMSDYREWFVVLLVMIAGGIWIGAKCNGQTEKYFEKCQEKISANCVQRDGYTQYLGEYERGKEIRIFRLERLLIQRLMDAHHFNDRALDERNRGVILSGGTSEMSNVVIMILIRCVTAAAALTGRITLGSMMQYIQSMDALTDAASGAWALAITLWYNANYLERYFEFLDTPSKMNQGCIPVEKRVDGDYRISFEHVSFCYPGSERYALKDINMEFQVGEKLAVVGMNGSGKSTFIKLLCRLYDPTEGTIYMNGIDIRRYDYREYLDLFSVVFQDFKLFSFGLGENVAVAEEYPREGIRESLEKSGLEEFLEKQKYGLDTVLYRDFDKEGVEVSGGEAQKIALARAICKGAPFVILDEPTAALDPLAEYEIYKRFNDLVADRTTVYISHRMSSCRFCGDIAVFHEGRLMQRGSHEELMRQTDGKYYELWTAQAQHYV